MSEPESQLSESDRAAMRAYLQRAEVRISTQHRIGTAFIGGAGLLLLIPVYMRDIVNGEMSVLISMTGNQFPLWDAQTGLIGTAALLLCLGVPIILSLFIPIFGVYLLLKDLVHFYFTLYSPGFSNNLLNPTLALGGINFSPDESAEVKQRVMKYQYVNERMDYMMPFSHAKREAYFDQMLAESGGEILPGSRDIETLQRDGIIGTSAEDTVAAQHFNTAMGLARALDRNLVEETAISEMHLVRNTLYLRRLMLRYVKVLLLFVWTTTVSFLMLPLLSDARFPNVLILALGYTAWSLAVMPLLRLPANWIYRYRYDNEETHHMDAQMLYLEKYIRKWCNLSVVMSFVALALAFISTSQLSG